MSSRPPSIHSDIRRLSWRLRSILIRQTARKAFDLTRFGSGPLERFCSALILGAAFFLLFLLGSLLVGLGTFYGLFLAGTVLITVMATSAVLILWSSDATLEEERTRVREDLAKLRELAAQYVEVDVVEEAAEVAPIPVQERRREPQPPPRVVPKRPRTQRCPYCSEVILASAVKCKHCGEFLDADLRHNRRFSPGVAAVLSFLFAGLGQLYKGQVLGGFVWFFFVGLGYCCLVVPGVFLHVVCIFDAASGGGD